MAQLTRSKELVAKMAKTEWLNPTSAEDWKWVAKYLMKRKPDIANFWQFKITYENVKAAIDALSDDPEGRLLLITLNGAYRQRKYRSPTNGRQARTFSLPNAVIRKLDRIKLTDKTETETVIDLINGAETMLRDHREQKNKLRAALAGEREKSKQAATSFNAQLEEAIKQFRPSLRRLAIWEEVHGGDLPYAGIDEQDINEQVEKAIKQIKRAIFYADGQLPQITENTSE